MTQPSLPSDFKEKLEAALKLGVSSTGDKMSSFQPAYPSSNDRNDTRNHYQAEESGGKAGCGNNTQKRKLTLAMPPVSQENTVFGMTPCKSPKITSSGPNRLSAICTICMEDLFAYAENDLTSASPGMEGNHSQVSIDKGTIRPTVGTRCGHVFHTECINKWFKENVEKEVKECPFCKREMMANDTTRIYPIFGEEWS